MIILKMQNQSEWQRQNEESVMCMQLICYKQLNTIQKKVHHAFYNANFKQKGGAFFSSTEIHHMEIIFNRSETYIFFPLQTFQSAAFCLKCQSGSCSGSAPVTPAFPAVNISYLPRSSFICAPHKCD